MLDLAHKGISLAVAASIFIGCAFVSCTDVRDFDTAQGEAFCGSIVPAPFVRSGFSPGVSVRLHLHPDSDIHPGDISTSDGKLREATLYALPEVRHDALDGMQLGQGQVRSILYAVKPAEGTSGFVIVSLLEDGSLELRVFRGVPSVAKDAGTETEGNPYLFGLFLLEKKKGTCGF